jgi:carboxyl-terminal processing protease
MVKRLVVILSGAVCGILLAAVVLRLHPGWIVLPDRELDRNAEYFRTVLELVRTNYVDGKKADADQLTRAALDGMVKSLDPHSEFMRADAYRELREDMDGKFGGIGIQVELRGGKVVVVAPIANTPGERAGILRADEIAKIDGQSTEKLGMDQVVDRLRGKPGTKVTVTFFRPSTKATFDVALTREIIPVESVRGVRMVGDGIGYVQLTEFSKHTGEAFKKALQELRGLGARAFILDLRNNPGGLLDEGVAVAESFFKPGELIVYTQGRSAANREEWRAGSEAGATTEPVAVLVNSSTASAAEIVAGALKDTRRAVIVGETTFGKGSVQTLFQLQNGEALRLTTAHYYTPSGVIIQEKGIEPEVKVVVSPEDEANAQLQRVRRDLSEPKEFAARFGFAPVEDRPLQAAIDLLKGVNLYVERSGMKRADAPVKP